MIRFISLLALLTPACALAVPESNYGVVQDLLANRNGFFTSGSFPRLGNASIHFTKFGQEPGANGCLVVSPGQGEPSIKYLETAYDLSQKGFSPIYVIDHRGQGASSRLLPDPQKNTVADFNDYAADFSAFVDGTVLKDPACRGHHVSLLAHSMGGAVAALYLEKEGANSPFRKVVLSSPMMKIIYPGGRTEDGVINETFFVCGLGLGAVAGMSCDDFAPGEGPYDPNAPFLGNNTTHSALRFQFKKDIYTDWPNLEVGGPTIRWVRQAALADKRLRLAENAGHCAAPILLLQAGSDKIVDNAGEAEFCANAHNCQLQTLNGASHELFMESDSIRDQAINALVSFLGN